MIKLNKPKISQCNVINDCINNMKSGKGTSRERITLSKKEIIKQSENYDKLALKGCLHTLKGTSKITGGATKEDMTNLYSKKFVPVTEGGRKYYEEIKLSAPLGRCPYCGQREVSTLDHYLPKAIYPVYAITTYNLVPSCFDCNKGKMSKVFSRREDETIHPYYDDFTDKIWIKAKLIEEEPIAFEFYVKKPLKWNSVKYERAKNHFKVFDLNKLYKPYASEEFIGCLNRIKKVYCKGGKEFAIEFLNENIEDKEEVRLNTWQAAMYKAIIDSDWFWDEYLQN